jgi:hypothetical protein
MAMEDEMLAEISEVVDEAILDWMNTYKMPPLNLSAIILARLTWLAKMGKYQDDFIQILKEPERILEKDKQSKVIH